MLPMRNHTMSSAAIICGLMILWVAGCEQPEAMPRAEPLAASSDIPLQEKSDSPRAPGRVELVSMNKQDHREAQRRPAHRDASRDQPIDSESSSPEPEEVASTASETVKVEDVEKPAKGDTNDKKPAPPPDPGAKAFLEVLRKDLAANPAVGEPPLRIGLGRICNMSRASGDEYLQFRQRLATMLAHAGEALQIEITTDPETDVALLLRGSAYLIMADGFDWWELHLRLVTPDCATTLWHAEAPLRVLRRPRPIGQQMFFYDGR